MSTDVFTSALTNLFNWIALTLGVDMTESELSVRYEPTPSDPKRGVDVTFTIVDKSPEALAEADFRLLHGLVIAFQPAGDVTIGVVEGYETDANLSISLQGIFVSRVPVRPGMLSNFQTLAIKRLGSTRPYENSENMHRDQGK